MNYRLHIIFGAFFSVSLLIGQYASFGEVIKKDQAAQSTEAPPSDNPGSDKKITFSAVPSGSYEPFNYWQKIRLAGTALVNPSRAEETAIVYGYRASDILNDPNALKWTKKKLSAGEISYAPAFSASNLKYSKIGDDESYKLLSDFQQGKITDKNKSAVLNGFFLAYSPEVIITAAPIKLISWDAELSYVVQVGVSKSQTDALASFADVQQNYPRLLSGYRPIIKRANLGKDGVEYRLNVGPIKSKQVALDLCKALRTARMKECLVRSQSFKGGMVATFRPPTLKMK